MDKPIISIIIPVYNGAGFVARSAQSALVQTYGEIEVLLIDDGSTDETSIVALEWQKKDKRIKLISIQNSGVSAARKVGIDNASGQWICFLDVDDTFPETAIETYSQYLSNTPEIIASGEPEKLSLSEYKSGLMRRISHPELWGKLFRADFIKQHYPTIDRTIIIGEDQTINLVLANHAQTLITIPELLYCYNLSNPDSVTKKFRRTEEYEIRFERLFDSVVRTGFESYSDALQFAEYKMKIEGFKMVILDGNRFDPWTNEWLDIAAYYRTRPKGLASSEKLLIYLSHAQWLYAIIMRFVLFFNRFH